MQTERTSYFFANITHVLEAPSFGKMEDVYFTGKGSWIDFKLPKLIYREAMFSRFTFLSGKYVNFIKINLLISN